MRRILVWDWPTRLFHWLAVALVAVCYATWQLNWTDWHVWAGEALLVLVFFRLLWGFFGSETARFRHFLAPPAAAAAHLRGVIRRDPDRQVGHNAAGGWSVLLLLALLLGETLTGLYVLNDVADVGPMTPVTPAPVANFITDLHLRIWYALLAAVALHLIAIAFYEARRHKLLLPMLTGRKSLPDEVAAPRIAGTARALLLLALSALAVAALAAWL